MTRLRNTLAALLLCSAVTSCTDTSETEARPTVAVSVLPFAWVVDRLSDDRVRTVVMLPPGASPTQHQPTLGQLRALGDAALYVKVGHPHFPFEATWLDRLLEGAPGLRVVDASAGLSETSGDPHVWVAPHHVAAIAREIAGALAEILPAQSAEVRANLARLEREIGALDREIRETFEAALAAGKGRAFLVQHPAWGYFAEAYGLEQVAVEHHRREPDPHALAERIEWARRNRIPVVFVQPQFDPTPAQTVAREIGARVVPLDPLAYDWADNLREVARAVSEGLSEGARAVSEGPSEGARAVSEGPSEGARAVSEGPSE
jgi:zinc transport system substrate-binding protein